MWISLQNFGMFVWDYEGSSLARCYSCPSNSEWLIIMILQKFRTFHCTKEVLVLLVLINRYRRRDVVEGVSGECPGVQRYQKLGISQQLSGKDIHGNTGVYRVTPQYGRWPWCWLCCILWAPSVVVMHLGSVDVSKYETRDLMQHTLYMMLGVFDDPDLQLHGWVIIEVR